MRSEEGENVIATLFEEGLRLSASQSPSPGGPLSRHMPSSSIALANRGKVFLMHLTVLD